MGMDVHPLAVTIAKINYMLAILPHLAGSGKKGQRAIPISLANSLQRPSASYTIKVIEVPIEERHGKPRTFQIPISAARRPNELAEVLREMGRYAASMAGKENISYTDFGRFVQQQLPRPEDPQQAELERQAWITNARYLTQQIAEGRDSIWVYLLQNTSRPLILQHRKFDMVVGNPPWIAYRYLQDAAYQKDVKTLTREYGLLDAGDVKLHTQIELSTLFFEHCRSVYLKAGGTIAFVMPRSVITGAKQHRAFQQKGFSRVLDLKGVAPLFNVETCVMILGGETAAFQAIPTTRYAGRLPRHECKWVEAGALLTREEATTSFAGQSEIASPYYHPRIINGANLYPRNLAFVTSAQPNLQPGELAHTSIMRTDPDVNDEAKPPWKGLALEGHIDDAFLYATLLSKQLVPFGTRRLHLVALPVKVGIPRDKARLPGIQPDYFVPVSLAEMREPFSGLDRSADQWFAPAEQLWKKYKKATTKETLADWLNYQNKVTTQSAVPGYLVLYGATGSNISACVVDTYHLPVLNGAKPGAFVVDHKTYWYRSEVKEEAHFLSALLNAPCVDTAIKAHQTRGLFGPRDIHRRPFEVCPIPQYEPGNEDHRRLAELSQQAHGIVGGLDLRAGGVVAARKQARQAARAQIAEIDAIAQRLLGLAPAALPSNGDAGEEDEADEDAESAGE